MPQNTSPIFALTPNLAQAYLSGTYTDRTGVTAGLTTLVTAGASGSKITQIGVKFTGNTITGSLMVFVTNTAGANPRIFDEIPIPVFTVTAVTGSYRAVTSYSDFQINSGSRVQVGVTALSSSVSCSVFAMQGDF
jgi:hypothetical protein